MRYYSKFLIVAGCINATEANSQTEIPETIMIWVNSYISANTENGYIIEHPALGIPVVRAPFGISCYGTDNRLDSDDIDASSRLHGRLKLKLIAQAPFIEFVEERVDVGQTVEYGCATEDIGCIETDEIEEEEIKYEIEGNLLRFKFDLAAGNPCDFWADKFGSIDLEVSVEINLFNGEIDYFGSIAEFPAYEMYLQYDNETPVQVFSFPITNDASPTSLLGEASKEISGQTTIFE